MIITKEVNGICLENISKEYCSECVNQCNCPLFRIYQMGKDDAYEEMDTKSVKHNHAF